MSISEFLAPESVSMGIAAHDKAELMAAMLKLVAGRPQITDMSVVERDVQAREQAMSTGVGKGLALPHAKTQGVSETVAALAVLAKPVPFDAVDGLPVQIVFLVLGIPEAKSQHVKILSRVSRLMNQEAVRRRMLAAKNDDELFAALEDAENHLLDE
ncbi:MAG: PTS sugar transporter subunit IIA [Bacteroidetes bacterium CG12_big_fil_rev_8_21_14_0_65_60_17]|nr:MAG: PTS sugar transporter subunit IIA [Bacteroidetes bacterium CG12_big_fil_rev_8_21_14_0_65_60_17]